MYGPGTELTGDVVGIGLHDDVATTEAALRAAWRISKHGGFTGSTNDLFLSREASAARTPLPKSPHLRVIEAVKRPPRMAKETVGAEAVAARKPPPAGAAMQSTRAAVRP